MNERKKAVTSEPIHELMARRWSPRALDPDKPVERETLISLFEAARWAPSCFNDQPWRYLVWNRFDDAATWEKALNCLAEGNQAWARRAPVLMASIAGSEFEHTGKPNRWGPYDTGAASENLCLQACALDLAIHQMGGFDAEKLRQEFSIPDAYTPFAMIAVGYPGDPELLSDKNKETELAQRERNPIAHSFFAGRWEQPFQDKP